MFAAPYSLDEVQFAYCNRVFLRWRTHRNRPLLALSALDQDRLSEIAAQYGLEILTSASGQNELIAQVSMKPDESISNCASKLKGQVSKWLRLRLGLETPADLLSKGYFACTVGNSTSTAVEAYLSECCLRFMCGSMSRPPLMIRFWLRGTPGLLPGSIWYFRPGVDAGFLARQKRGPSPNSGSICKQGFDSG